MPPLGHRLAELLKLMCARREARPVDALERMAAGEGVEIDQEAVGGMGLEGGDVGQHAEVRGLRSLILIPYVDGSLLFGLLRLVPHLLGKPHRFDARICAAFARLNP